ncbi:sporulation protein [Methylobacterium sp. Leaf87]|uniref:SPOR domain-containing protein n=1 Tax=Methylobacterium sp. Leaf87 TaxID=1736243 RepID=UPI00070073D4|nr:SPOR domain-containing protein [Methylobacterium sp. Leaf87]KQO70451.1 sporulation protein [Methylobacterium sp. Leaf87]
MTTNASRATVDFDAFARDLQQPQGPASHGLASQGPASQGAGPQGQPVRAPQAHAKSDPLAELARIVGQDDPFRAILEARDGRSDPASGRRIEPSFVDAPVAPGRPAQPQAPAHQTPAASSPTDAFDQYLASVEQDPYQSQGADSAPQAEQDAFASGERATLGRPRQRSRLVSVGAGLGVLAVCITGGLAWRGLHAGGGASGGVPTILADTAPLKIAPQKADGVEIPDQNKQIYDRTAKDGQIRIVNREEQPLDVAQAARSAQRTGEGGATPGSSSPQQTGTLTESLGEPRRVRTVSVKPDTPVPPSQPEAAEAAPASVIPTMTLPGAPAEGSTAAGSLRPRSARVTAPVSVPTTTPVAEAPAPEPVVPAPAPVPRVKAPQRVAAVAPETTAAVSPTAAAVAESPAPAAGSFSVQLGVRASAAEAQAAFKQLQGKFIQLAGQPALIRQAEVNGKSLYRVRVGPLGKNEATSLCTQLQGAGGQCFVAKN